ncbi:MAG: hypothetical protein EPN57_20440 [Paraburkholderia sp.]|nr:MAG: hypothetical protein EPN57_20440 [Paraburkholderia sp.]
MQAKEGQKPPAEELDVRDQISRKLLGASSMLLLMQGDGRRLFESMGDLWQDGYLETLFDLTEAARTLNARRGL